MLNILYFGRGFSADYMKKYQSKESVLTPFFDNKKQKPRDARLKHLEIQKSFGSVVDIGSVVSAECA